jgi:hypothetical protein
MGAATSKSYCTTAGQFMSKLAVMISICMWFTRILDITDVVVFFFVADLSTFFTINMMRRKKTVRVPIVMYLSMA